MVAPLASEVNPESGLVNSPSSSGNSKNKQLTRRLCSNIVHLVQILSTSVNDLKILNYYTSNAAILLDSSFYGTGCAYFFYTELPVAYLSPDNIAFIFNKLYLRRHTLSELNSQDQVGFISALSSLATTQFCPVSVIKLVLEFLITQLIVIPDNGLNPQIQTHSIDMIGFILKVHPFITHYVLNYIDESYTSINISSALPDKERQKNPKMLAKIFESLTNDTLMHWSAKIEDIFLLKNWLFSDDKIKNKMAKEIFKKYNYCCLENIIVYQLQTIFLEYEIQKHVAADKWMIEILLNLDLENLATSAETDYAYPAHMIVKFFHKKCHQNPEDFTVFGIPLLSGLIFLDKYTLEICHLLQRSTQSLSKITIAPDQNSELVDLMFHLVGKSEAASLFSKIISGGTQAPPYLPTSGCKILTKTAIVILESSKNLLKFWCSVFFHLQPGNILNNPNVVFGIDKILNFCILSEYECFDNCVHDILGQLFEILRQHLQELKRSEILFQARNTISNFVFRSDETVIKNSQNYLCPVSLCNEFPYHFEAPYLSLALLMLDCEHYSNTKTVNIWKNLILVLSKNPIIDIQPAIKSAISQMNYENQLLALNHEDFQGMLPIVICMELINTYDKSEINNTPLLPLILYNFFHYFFDRRDSKSKRVGARIFKDELYEDLVRTFKTSLEYQVKFYPKIATACRLWLDEPRLMQSDLEIEKQGGLDLPTNFDPEFLNSQSDVNTWLKNLDVINLRDRMDAMCKSTDKIEFSLVRSKSTNLNKKLNRQITISCKKQIFETLKEKTEHLLTSVIANPDLPEVAPEFICPIIPLDPRLVTDASYLLSCVNDELKSINLYSQSLASLNGRISVLDDTYMTLVPSLYSNSSTTSTLNVACQSGFTSNTCAGPAQVSVKHKEKRFNQAISSHVKTNRDQYRKLLQSAVQSNGWELGVDSESMKVLFPDVKQEDMIKDGFLTMNYKEEAPPDYHMPENDSPAISALNLEQYSTFLTNYTGPDKTKICNSIFEVVLEARLKSRNLVSKDILLDFIDIITELAEPPIQKIIDYIQNIRFNSTESKAVKDSKMEDAAKLVQHFRPKTPLTNNFLYRQVLYALIPNTYYNNPSENNIDNYQLRELEAQMFFSILTKFDLSDLEAFHYVADAQSVMELTFSAIESCRDSIHKAINKAKKNNSKCRIAWMVALAEQLLTHFMKILMLFPNEFIRTTLHNLLYKSGNLQEYEIGSNPSSHPPSGKYAPDFEHTFKAFWSSYTTTVSGLEELGVTNQAKALLSDITVAFTQIRSENKSIHNFNIWLGTELTNLIGCLLVKQIKNDIEKLDLSIEPVNLGVNINPTETIKKKEMCQLDKKVYNHSLKHILSTNLKTFDIFLDKITLNNQFIYAWSEETKHNVDPWFLCLFNSIEDSLDSDKFTTFGFQSIILYYLKNINGRNTLDAVQNYWIEQLRPFISDVDARHPGKICINEEILDEIYVVWKGL